MSKSDNPFLKKTNKHIQKKPENIVGDRWNNIKNDIELENNRRQEENTFKKYNNKKNHYSKFLRYSKPPKKEEKKKEFNLEKQVDEFPSLSVNK